MELKERLTVFRRQQGLTQDELALKIGVSRQTISKWERGAAVPSTESLVALGRLYGVPLDELANGDLQPGEEPAAAVAVMEEPDTPREPGKRWAKLRGGAVLAVCLLLVTIAAVITIWSAIAKEWEKPKRNVISQDDLEWEYIDLEELVPFDGTGEIME